MESPDASAIFRGCTDPTPAYGRKSELLRYTGSRAFTAGQCTIRWHFQLYLFYEKDIAALLLPRSPLWDRCREFATKRFAEYNTLFFFFRFTKSQAGKPKKDINVLVKPVMKF